MSCALTLPLFSRLSLNSLRLSSLHSADRYWCVCVCVCVWGGGGGGGYQDRY